MSEPDRTHNTLLLRAAARGEVDAETHLMERLFDELRRVASSLLAQERNSHTLQPTALVHEAYLRLIDTDELAAGDRQRFFGLAARAMRRVLVDHARRRRAEHRGGDWQRVELESDLLPGGESLDGVLEVDEVLQRFASVDPRASQVVELRLFAGLSSAEAAEVLGVSERTARNDWSTARAWLSRELTRGED
ncbi:MAG: extracytoplasmic sigma factor ECF [Planctomycetota bacterium]|nr:MAG: extracytoplasmic sigma factor ECF [Planctomycetota bacterium]